MIVFSVNLSGQIIYNGSIGKQPVELNLIINQDSTAKAVYQYKKYQQPIDLYGQLINDTLRLKESDDATILIYGYSTEKKILKGVWRDQKTKKQFPVSLSKIRVISYDNDAKFSEIEILQSSRLKDHSFKVVLSKEEERSELEVTSIKIHNIKDASLDQELNCEGIYEDFLDYSPFNIIEAADYNKDGYDDLSVFEMRFANGATSRIYYLYNPESKMFYDGFSGADLEFDNNNTATSSTFCCGHRGQTIMEYKIEDGKLITISETEINYNEDFDETDKHCYTYESGNKVECECK